MKGGSPAFPGAPGMRRPRARLRGAPPATGRGPSALPAQGARSGPGSPVGMSHDLARAKCGARSECGCWGLAWARARAVLSVLAANPAQLPQVLLNMPAAL